MRSPSEDVEPNAVTLRALDHLVVAASTIDEGSRRVTETVGVDLDRGGEHPLMGTHNRLLRLGSTAYIEVIAIDPEALPPSRPRWFALDDPVMQARLARGPSLVHWVVRTGDVMACRRAIPDVGPICEMRRGAFAWRITVREDGALPFDGIIPSFIAWNGDAHPVDSLPDRGLQLLRLEGTHPRRAEMRATLASLHLDELLR